MRARPALLLLAFGAVGCAGGQEVTTMGAVPPNVTVDVVYEPYAVAGSDVRTLTGQLRARSPWARFNWFFNTQYTYGPTPGRASGTVDQEECVIQEFHITLTVSMIQPSWQAPTGASDTLVAQWAAFEEGLRIHMEGHRDIALRAVDNFQRRLSRLTTRNCSTMRVEYEHLQRQVMDRWREVSAEYDVETARGQTQGAVWPPGSTNGNLGPSS